MEAGRGEASVTPRSNGDCASISTIMWTERQAEQFLESIYIVCPSPKSSQLARLAHYCCTTNEHVTDWFERRRLRAAGQAVATPYMDMHVVCEPVPPHRLMWASDYWLRFCGYTAAEVPGLTFKCVQGPLTDPDVTFAITDAASRCEGITAALWNYTRDGTPFFHSLRVTPLVDDLGHLECFKVKSQKVAVGRNPDPTDEPIFPSSDWMK
jgi:hypothetical protein